MKKLIETVYGEFFWQKENEGEITRSVCFTKDSEQYDKLISSGCGIELSPQSDKDEYQSSVLAAAQKLELSRAAIV